MNGERLSISDDSLLACYADHVIRYQFALPYCRDKSVLDAGCGTGYGSYFLSRSGAARVLAVDISADALAEAKRLYQRDNLRFESMNVEALPHPELSKSVEVIINFENIEHLPNPEKLVDGAAATLSLQMGVFVTSTPNGAISDRDANGKLCNPFHVNEFTQAQFLELLGRRFGNIELFGEWVTHGGLLRKVRAREAFQQSCEAYYNPMSKLGRMLKRFAGKPSAPPPKFTAGGDGYPGDFDIQPLNCGIYPWPPMVLIAVCRP